MNKVFLVGRLTRDAEVRYATGSEPMAIARFTMAVDRRKKDVTEADFISCVAFGKRGEFLERFGKRGTKFIIEGRLQTGSYEKEGQKHYTTDVVVDTIEFAESKKADTAQATSSDFVSIPEGIEEELPFK